MKKKSAREMLILARKQEKAGDFLASKNTLTELLVYYPKNNVAKKRISELSKKQDQALLSTLPLHQKDILIGIAQQGMINQAIAQATLLLKRYPKDTFLSNFLGEMNLKVKRWSVSQTYYELTLKNDSKNKDAIFNLALLYEMSGHLAKAREFYNHLISLDKQNYHAYNNLAAILLDTGDVQAAEENYINALEVKSDYPDALNNYGMLLTKSERYDEAISYCKAAVKFAPDNPLFVFNLCDLLERCNRLTELGIFFEETSKKIDITNPKIAFQLGKYKFRIKEYDAAVKILESIPANSLPNLIEIKRLSILGKSHDMLNNAYEAFQNFSLANNSAKENYLKNNSIQADTYISTIEENLEKILIHKDQISHVHEGNLPQFPSPIYLIGFPRSGTTLLDTILRSHPKVQVVEEKPMLIKSIGSLKGIDQFINDDFTAEERSRKQKIYFEELKEYADLNAGNIIIDKLPLNMINLIQIKSIFPDAKFIFSVRHPCDCILSCFMQDFNLNDAMLNFLTIEGATNLYDKAMSLWKHAYTILDAETCFIKYESLITNFDNEISKCLQFLELEWHDDLKKYRDTAVARGRIHTPSYNQVSQELYTSAINRWRKYETQLSSSMPVLEPWISYWEYD